MSNHFKYPRTFHLPFSKGFTNDDKVLNDLSWFDGMHIVGLEKMDGENTSMYPDKIHARSLDSAHHDSRNWVKGLWGTIRHQIPDGWRICGENLYAKHSLYYDNLPSYFMVFNIWDEDNICLSWDDTKAYCEMLGLITVPILWEGIFNEGELKKLADGLDTNKQEGFVIRNSGTFAYDDFEVNIAKWVREKHVTTNEHWMQQEIIPNKIITL